MMQNNGNKRRGGAGPKKPRALSALWLWPFIATLFFTSCETTTETNAPVAIYHRDSGALVPFPSNRFSVPAQTATGIRPDILSHAPSDDLVFSLYSNMASEIEKLDGFGTSAPIIIRFTENINVDDLPGKIDEFAAQVTESTADESPIGLVDATTGERLPFFWRYDYDSYLLAIYPSNSLNPKSDYIYYVTNRLSTFFGNSFGPDERFSALIGSGDFTVLGETHGAQVLEDTRWIVEVIGVKPILVDRFTTQSIQEETDILIDRVLSDYREPIYNITDTGRGEKLANVRVVYEPTWTQYDYRDENGRLDAAAERPHQQERLPFYIGIPMSGSQPFPTILIQHGLGDSRAVLLRLVDLFASFGFATIAIDASGHGDRIPEGTNYSDYLDRLRDMLGFWVSRDRFDFQLHKSRDLLRQSVIDQVEIRQALRNTTPAVLDFDNDGTIDLDLGQFFYYGQSMGAIIGVMTVAQTEDIPAAVLNVGGARLADFLFYHPMFVATWPAFEAHLENWGNVLRWSGLMQTIIERGDPANYAEMMQLKRPQSGPERDILMQFVLNDIIVPNNMNWQLARDAHLPLLLPSPILPDQQSATLDLGPENISANFAGRTAGYVIFDDNTTQSGKVVTATHFNNFTSLESAKQAACFFHTNKTQGIATIVSNESDCH